MSSPNTDLMDSGVQKVDMAKVGPVNMTGMKPELGKNCGEAEKFLNKRETILY